MGDDRIRKQATDADVILLGLESVRADHFAERCFPECWRFSEEFARFENAYANGVSTPLS
jgi:membrane-anchored protein YejM (alkaline phosphatase superfamily)